MSNKFGVILSHLKLWGAVTQLVKIVLFLFNAPRVNGSITDLINLACSNYGENTGYYPSTEERKIAKIIPSGTTRGNSLILRHTGKPQGFLSGAAAA